MDVSRGRRRGPVPLVMTGPLSPYESLLRAELASLGYAGSSVTDAVRMMRRLSTWMDRRELALDALEPSKVEEFLAFRRAVCESEPVARRSLGVVIKVLRNAGVVPAPVPTGGGAVEKLLADYGAYLRGERGLAAESVRCYCGQARKFLAALPTPLEASLTRLDAARVTAVIVRHATECDSVWSAKALVTAVRSLLRYLHVDGRIPAPLTGAVPAVAGWRLDSLPRGLTPQQVAALLSAPDLRTPAGQRDRAILVTLARLGLRGAEVAALQLSDIDWHAGEIAVRGKGSRIERLPLPTEVGETLAGYLTDSRPRCSATAVFVTARAPYQALTGTCIRAVMRRACDRAGLPRMGAHRLRHSLATTILRAGAPLPEVGQVLRHRSQLSTTIYAKVDHTALRTLAQPWPEGGAR
ncbi:site-specific integrase [Streptomyces sp. NPDC090442]|uniref:site-specific integrase n=1 Tax=Streptomyces sp. NPDC090442 TaxID=3365962 RepID=UPI0037F7F61C